MFNPTEGQMFNPADESLVRSFERVLEKAGFRKLLVSAGTVAALLVVWGTISSALAEDPHPKIRISVKNLATGQDISHGETLHAVTPFQVTVTGDDTDCAGQFVVTARGPGRSTFRPSPKTSEARIDEGPFCGRCGAGVAPPPRLLGPGICRRAVCGSRSASLSCIGKIDGNRGLLRPGSEPTLSSAAAGAAPPPRAAERAPTHSRPGSGRRSAGPCAPPGRAGA